MKPCGGLIEKNVRIPIQVLGDMRAQLSACTIAENQFLELVDRFGLETTRFYMGEVIDHTERPRLVLRFASFPMESSLSRTGLMMMVLIVIESIRLLL